LSGATAKGIDKVNDRAVNNAGIFNSFWLEKEDCDKTAYLLICLIAGCSAGARAAASMNPPKC